ncbi:MAG TPA: filamentous hemagglutinin N-terminal domain-containing protein [Chroococcales cyanobacterium]
MTRFIPCFWAASSIVLGCATISPAKAQIVPDNTLPVNSRVTPGCIVCTIDGGTQRGVNLFHSFSEFSVPTGGEAFFNNALQIQNIFSRVTGNSVSNIDGLLRTNGTASLFFLNPNGVIFGQNARLEIGGSFFATTASSFKFPNGSKFSGTNPQAPPLLMMNVTPGVQYGTNQPRATIANAGNLVAGQDLTLAAGNLDLQGQLVAGRDLTLQATDTVKMRDSATSPFIASSGRTLLVQGNQAVDIFALNHPNSGLFSGGNMVLRSANTVGGDAHYWSGGSFRIEKLDGSLGDLYSPYDPIIRSLGDVSFDAYQGTSLHILAGGEVNIGTIVITGAETGVAGVDYLQETVPLSNGSRVSINGSLQPTLDIRAGVAPAFIGVSGVTGFDPATDGFFGQGSLTDVPTSANITIGDVVISPNGLVFITNQYQPNPALPGGDITVTGAGVFGDGLNATGFGGNGSSVILDSRRNIAITNSGIDSSSNASNAGDITLLANETVSLTNSIVFSNTAGVGKGGDINIQARQLQVTDGTQVSASTSGEGKGGNLIVNASQGVQVMGSSTDGQFVSGLFVQTDGTGNGGNVQITTLELLVTDGATVNVSTFGEGKGGNLIVNASKVVQLMGTSANGPFASSLVAATLDTGDGGNIQITTPQLLVTDGAVVNASTIGDGNGGSLMINASEAVQLIGTTADGQFASGLGAVTLGKGKGGNVEITTPLLLVTDGATVNVSTEGEGTGGRLFVNASKVVQLIGTTANGQGSSGLFAQTKGKGDGGNVEITTPLLLVTDGAAVNVSTDSEGKGGRLLVNASEAVQLIGTSADGEVPSGLFAQTDGPGDGGNLEITTPLLLVTDGAAASASTFKEGKGGNLIVNASKSVQLSRTGELSVDATAGGIAGDLFVNTNKMSVTDGAQVTVSSPQGQAGNLNITANSLTLNRGTLSAVTGTSSPEGGANITLSGLELLRMDNESLISASALDNANGGNVTINSTLIVATPPTGPEGSDIIANAEQGNGGRVNVTTQGLFGIQFRPQRTPKNDITVSSTFGLSGTFALNTPGVDPSRGLAELPTNVVDASQQIDQRCTASNKERKSNSFTITGRGGISSSPNDTLQGESVITPNWITLNSQENNTPPAPTTPRSSAPKQLVEAQGWSINEQGQVVLTASSSNVTPHDTWQTPAHCPTDAKQ